MITKEFSLRYITISCYLYSFLSVLFLFFLQCQLNEQLLQLFIAVIDAKLLKTEFINILIQAKATHQHNGSNCI